MLIESSTDTGQYHFTPPPPHYDTDQYHYAPPPPHCDTGQFHYAPPPPHCDTGQYHYAPPPPHYDTGQYHYVPPPPHYYSPRPDQPHYESPLSRYDQPQYTTPTGIIISPSACTVYLYLPIVSTATASYSSYLVPLTDKPQPSKTLAQARNPYLMKCIIVSKPYTLRIDRVWVHCYYVIITAGNVIEHNLGCALITLHYMCRQFLSTVLPSILASLLHVINNGINPSPFHMAPHVLISDVNLHSIQQMCPADSSSVVKV